jgi:Nif-specific regulatory protein
MRYLLLLFKISEIIKDKSNQPVLFTLVLQAAAEELPIERCTITILNRNKSILSIEEANNLTAAQKARGKYKIGEGIIGKVVATGEPLLIPNVATDIRFLNKTRTRQNAEKEALAFACVPVTYGNEIIGTLSIDVKNTNAEELTKLASLLTVMGRLLAQNIKNRQEENEEQETIHEENQQLHEELQGIFKPKNIIGNSKAIHQSFQMLNKVASTDTTVLIRGESGVGKELFAAAIHHNSTRAKKPFIKVNCSALPETLIESELFGHERGAFTGADKLRIGRFEAANGGTIFLDEIGDLPLATQVKILRVLQEKEYERLGSAQTLKADVRVITATNRDLEVLIEEGKFREDLFYRLNVFPIYVPNLRDRRSDITLLADYFVEKFNQKNGKNIKRISTSAIDMLMSYHWPGNVRELENCIERASILCNEDVIYGYHLPPTLQTPNEESMQKGSLQSILDTVEKELIQDTLKMTKGNMTKAAEHLGITERKMGLRVNKYGIDPKRFKNK